MPSLTKFLSETTGSESAAAEWLQLLVGDWNLVADLLRSDLVLWIEREDGVIAIAHCRPATGQSVYYEDPVGHPAPEDIAGRISALLSGTEVDPAALPLERE